jgi:hypothetical protein
MQGEYKMTKYIVTAILLTLASTAQAELYLELNYDGGGDTLISTTSGDDINAGGGINYVIGIQNKIGEKGKSLSLAMGYMIQSMKASNGTAEISTLTVDAIYSIPVNVHRFGIGASYHIGPTYKDDIAGFAPLKIDFDNALGLLLQYSYAYSPRFQIGARITEMDYEVNGLSLDASSFGIFLSNGF